MLVATTTPRSCNGCSFRYYPCALERSNHSAGLLPVKLSEYWSQTGNTPAPVLPSRCDAHDVGQAARDGRPEGSGGGHAWLAGAVAVATAVGRRRTAGWPKACAARSSSSQRPTGMLTRGTRRATSSSRWHTMRQGRSEGGGRPTGDPGRSVSLLRESVCTVPPRNQRFTTTMVVQIL